MRDFRTLNSIVKRLEAFRSTSVGGRVHFGLMYCAAHTRRWGGGGGAINGQNINGRETFGINLRHLIQAPPGRKLIIADLSQIEVRVLMYLAGFKEMLDRIRDHKDIYQAFAEMFKLWEASRGSLEELDTVLRKLVKAIVLGCGFGASYTAFAAMSNVSPKVAQQSVELYRNTMQPVVAFWDRCIRAASAFDSHSAKVTRMINGKPTLVDNDRVYRVTLPSGNVLNYREHRRCGDGIIAKVMGRGAGGYRDAKLWHGLLAENATQATARDIFGTKLLEIEDAFPGAIIYHVHDEVILEVDEDVAEHVCAEVTRILSTPPAWCASLPIACKAHISQIYDK